MLTLVAFRLALMYSWIVETVLIVTQTLPRWFDYSCYF